MLKICRPSYYVVKKGQTVKSVCAAFGVPPMLFKAENCLKKELFCGQIVKIPRVDGNVYTAQAGDSKALLCGSNENYEQKNKAKLLYPGLTVLL